MSIAISSECFTILTTKRHTRACLNRWKYLISILTSPLPLYKLEYLHGQLEEKEKQVSINLIVNNSIVVYIYRQAKQ